MLTLVLLTAALASDPGDPNSAQETARRNEVARLAPAKAKQVEMHVGEPGEKAELRAEPLLRWSNPTAGSGRPDEANVGFSVENDGRDLEANWAPSDFDRRHRVSFSGLVSLPAGFEVGAYAQFQSGRPFSVYAFEAGLSSLVFQRLNFAPGATADTAAQQAVARCRVHLGPHEHAHDGSHRRDGTSSRNSMATTTRPMATSSTALGR